MNDHRWEMSLVIPACQCRWGVCKVAGCPEEARSLWVHTPGPATVAPPLPQRCLEMSHQQSDAFVSLGLAWAGQWDQGGPEKVALTCGCVSVSCPGEGGPSEEGFLLDDVTREATRWLIITPRGLPASPTHTCLRWTSLLRTPLPAQAHHPHIPGTNAAPSAGLSPHAHVSILCCFSQRRPLTSQPSGPTPLLPPGPGLWCQSFLGTSLCEGPQG